MEQQDWNIKARADVCCKTDRPFEDGETFITELVWTENGYERRDWSEESWKTDGPTEGSVSMWQTVYHVPPPKPEEALKKETAETLLRELIENEEDDKANVIFVLAVMLERRRLLVEKDVKKRDDGALIRFYEHKKSGETYVVKDPQLSLSDLTHVQEEVITMLGGKKPGAEEVPEEEPQESNPEESEKSDPATESE